MTLARRTFLQTSMATAAITTFGAKASGEPDNRRTNDQVPVDRFDPWIEIDRDSIRANVGEIRRLAGGRPILAVIKNNAYGMGLVETAKFLESLPEIAGFAEVKAETAIALREGGIQKPLHLMAMFPKSAAADLARNNIQPSLYSADALELVAPMKKVFGHPVPAQVYLDTGMSRMGIPWHRAQPWIESIVHSGDVSIQGAFMGFTEDTEYDKEQLKRFLSVAEQAAGSGCGLGTLHTASSSAVFEFPEAHLDMVRPGIALFGGYPNDPNAQNQKATLRCAFRLKARVTRVEQLRTGDSVSYGRKYIASKPTWVATIPTGHTDGYPRKGAEGARILIGTQTWPVIGAVSASHSIVEIGSEQTVRVGDVATMMGPDVPEIDPNWIASKTGVSVYDLFMHLNPTLPRYYT